MGLDTGVPGGGIRLSAPDEVLAAVRLLPPAGVLVDGLDTDRDVDAGGTLFDGATGL
jgi:hypothetical protein